MSRAQRPPGYYGVSQTQTFSEASGVGGDYLAEVCRDWEAEALRSPTRTVIIRTGGPPPLTWRRASSPTRTVIIRTDRVLLSRHRAGQGGSPWGR